MFRVPAARLGCPVLGRVLHSRPSASSPGTTATRRRLSTPPPPPPPGELLLEVSPFGAVRARLGCSIFVRPLDPHAFPEADRASIAVNRSGAGAEVLPEELHVRYDALSKELRISAEHLDAGASLHLAAPIKTNLFITTLGEGQVQVRNMECDTCTVHTQRGDCLLRSIKGHQITVQSHGGDVTGVGTIHGNVDISTSGDGAVDVKKLQGTTMKVSTERGALKVRAIYAESSCVSSVSGSVELGLVHGSATVENVSGDTLVDGSNSLLKVSSQSGSVDVYVGDDGSAELQSGDGKITLACFCHRHDLFVMQLWDPGAVLVRVPSTLRAGVELRGASVDVSPEVRLHAAEKNTSQSQTTVTGRLNAEGPVDRWVRAFSGGGSVRLKTQSWFESLKLGA